MSSSPVPLWKQCLGAVIGACTALVLYTAFTFALDFVPSLTAAVGQGAQTVGEGVVAQSSAPAEPSVADKAREIAARKLRERGTAAEEEFVLPVVDGSEAVLPLRVETSARERFAAQEQAAAVASSSSSSARRVAQVAPGETLHSGAPLAQTGVGLWIASGLAFGAAMAFHRRALGRVFDAER